MLILLALISILLIFALGKTKPVRRAGRTFSTEPAEPGNQQTDYQSPWSEKAVDLPTAPLSNPFDGFKGPQTPVPEPTKSTTPALDDVIDTAPGYQPLNYAGSAPPAQTGPQTGSQQENRPPEYHPDDFKLGKIYGDKLKLSDQEVSWLNKFIPHPNGFNAIEGCGIAIIQLYLQALKAMVRRFANAPVSLVQHMDEIKNEARKHSVYHPGQYTLYEEKEIINITEADLYFAVYHRAEAVIREIWHGGQLPAASFRSRSPKAADLFGKHIEPVLDEVMTQLTAKTAAPDDSTELLLNRYSTGRWKHNFDKITAFAKAESKDAMLQQLYGLAALNAQNPLVENIYFEAAKFMAPVDKTEALKFYLHYVACNQVSARIDNKEMLKTTVKQLFDIDGQRDEFMLIIEELVASKDLKRALAKAAVFYGPKPDKISLNSHSIALAGQQVYGTGQAFNQYPDGEDNAPPAGALPAVTVAAIGPDRDKYGLMPVQKALLETFAEEGFELTDDTVSDFASITGHLKKQLIDNINEIFYEQLGDLMIEEEGVVYTVKPDYYKIIFA